MTKYFYFRTLSATGYIEMTQEEFEILSGRIRPRLVTLARKFSSAVRMDGCAEDIAQEAIMSLWKLANEGYPIRDAEALAVRITKSLCVAHFRKYRRERQWPTAEDTAGGSCATSLTDSGDFKKIKTKALSILSDTQRKYLHLRNEEGMSLDEISSLTGKPKNSIKSSISSARRAMLEIIKKEL